MKRGPYKVPSWNIKKQAFDAMLAGNKDIFFAPHNIVVRRMLDKQRVRFMNGHRRSVRQIDYWIYPSTIEDAVARVDLSRVCHGTAVETITYLRRIYKPNDTTDGVVAVYLVPFPKSP